MEQKVLRAVMVCLLLMSMAILGRETAAYVETVNAVNALRGNNADTDGIPTVVIDAGHGGDDPGKIGINGAPEKDINLRITEKLRQYLEADGIRVVLTRETEDGLYDASAPNKKVQDMKCRIEKIEQTDPVLTVSIHQNSYPEEYVHGAQVFYYNGSSGGEQLAGLIQTQLVQGSGSGEPPADQAQRQLLSFEKNQRNHRHCGMRLPVQCGRGGKTV